MGAQRGLGRVAIITELASSPLVRRFAPAERGNTAKGTPARMIPTVDSPASPPTT